LGPAMMMIFFKFGSRFADFMLESSTCQPIDLSIKTHEKFRICNRTKKSRFGYTEVLFPGMDPSVDD